MGLDEMGGRWGGARGASLRKRGAVDGAEREQRRQNKEGRSMGRGEMGGRWGGAKETAPKKRGAVNGTGRDGRTMGRGERSVAEKKRGGRWRPTGWGGNSGVVRNRSDRWGGARPAADGFRRCAATAFADCLNGPLICTQNDIHLKTLETFKHMVKYSNQHLDADDRIFRGA